MSRAIRSSSSVGMADASNFESSVEILSSRPSYLLVLCVIEAKSCPFHPRTNLSANVGRVFSDATREGNVVSAAHYSPMSHRIHIGGDLDFCSIALRWASSSSTKTVGLPGAG